MAARGEAAGGLLLPGLLPDLGPALAKTEREMPSFEAPPRSAVLLPEPPMAPSRRGPAKTRVGPAPGP